MVGLNIWTGPLSHAYLPQQALVKSHQGIIGADGVLASDVEVQNRDPVLFRRISVKEMADVIQVERVRSVCGGQCKVVLAHSVTF